MIDKDTIEKIKEAADIVEVVGDFVTLKKSGSSYKGLSPFTSEKTPSFFVSPSKQIFKCFSTGKGGDSIKFLMEHEGTSYVETLKYLADRYGVEIQEKEESPEQILAKNEKDSLFIVLNFAKEYFLKQLKETDEGKSIGLTYYKERGISDESINTFDLGYSVEAWDGLYKEATRLQYSEDILEKAGLIIKKENKTYDRFRGRVVFPIHNLTGKVIAFGARTLKTDKKVPKYINSPETAVYHKSDVLYGIHQAKNEIRNKNNCFLVEGYTDVISMYQAGLKNVVASSGTSLTEGQIKLISRYTQNITVIYDGDPAGIKASIRGIDLILEQDLDVNVVTLPEGEDPDSFSRSLGGVGFQQYIDKHSRDFISFKTELFLSEAKDDPIKRASVIKQVVETIAKINDSIKRTVYFQQCSSLLNIDENTLISEYNKIVLKRSQEGNKKTSSRPSIQKGNTGGGPSGPGPDGFDPPPIFIPGEDEPYIPPSQESAEPLVDEEKEIEYSYEREMMRLLLNYASFDLDDENVLYQYLLEELEGVEFQKEVYVRIIKEFKDNIAKGVLCDAHYFLKSEDEEIQGEVIDLVTEKYEVSEGWKENLIFVPKDSDILSNLAYKNIMRLKLKKCQIKSDEMMKEIMNSQSVEDEVLYQKMYLKFRDSAIQISNALGIVVSGK